jgi:hypothetical protein
LAPVTSEILNRTITSSPSCGARDLAPAVGTTLKSTAMPSSVKRCTPGMFAESATLSLADLAPDAASKTPAATMTLTGRTQEKRRRSPRRWCDGAAMLNLFCHNFL